MPDGFTRGSGRSYGYNGPRTPRIKPGVFLLLLLVLAIIALNCIWRGR